MLHMPEYQNNQRHLILQALTNKNMNTLSQTSSSQETSVNKETDLRSDLNPLIQTKSTQVATATDFDLKGSESATSLKIESQNKDSVYLSISDNESLPQQGHSA
jgi:hypothetical protein